MHLWSESDMITAFISRSPSARDFQEGMIELVKKNAIKEYMSYEEYRKLEKKYEEVQERLGRLEEIVGGSNPGLKSAASAAGLALQAQRCTKDLREFEQN